MVQVVRHQFIHPLGVELANVSHVALVGVLVHTGIPPRCLALGELLPVWDVIPKLILVVLLLLGGYVPLVG